VKIQAKATIALHSLEQITDTLADERHQQYFCQVLLCADDNYQTFWVDRIGPLGRFL